MKEVFPFSRRCGIFAEHIYCFSFIKRVIFYDRSYVNLYGVPITSFQEQLNYGLQTYGSFRQEQDGFFFSPPPPREMAPGIANNKVD